MEETQETRDKPKKYNHGSAYRRNRHGTQFDTLMLANELKHKVTIYVMDEKHVPKKWRYFNGRPAADYARYIRDCVSAANDIWLDAKTPDGEKIKKRKELQQKALSYCNILQQQLADICAECSGATPENMGGITDILGQLTGKIIKWSKSDSTRLVN